MLQTIGNRIEENKSLIKRYDEKKMEYWQYYIRSRVGYVQRLEINQAIQQRLTFYYFNTLNETMQVGCKEFDRQIKSIKL